MKDFRPLVTQVYEFDYWDNSILLEVLEDSDNQNSNGSVK